MGIPAVEVPGLTPAWSWNGLLGRCFVLRFATRDIAWDDSPSLFGLTYSRLTAAKCPLQPINVHLVSTVGLQPVFMDGGEIQVKQWSRSMLLYRELIAA